MRIPVLIIEALIVILLLPLQAWCQEFYLFGGISRDRDRSSLNSGAGALSYFEEVSKNLLLSFTWLNEGHLGSHHRDGPVFQLWYRHYLLNKSLSLEAGAGPYVFYDTIRRADQTINSRGVAPAFSLATTLHFNNNWLLQLRGNLISSGHDIDTLSLMLGLGYRTDFVVSSPNDTKKTRQSGSELALLAGQTADNSYSHGHKMALALEYRLKISRLFEWTAGWLNETDESLIGRYGPYTQIFIGRTLFDPRLAFGLGAGPYLAFDNRSSEDDSTVAVMLTMTGSFQFAPSWAARVSWNRVSTHYHSDADVVLGGISYRF